MIVPQLINNLLIINHYFSKRLRRTYFNQVKNRYLANKLIQLYE